MVVSATRKISSAATASAVETTPTYTDCSKAELWEIINTGRLFLRSLERFAIENFPENGVSASKSQNLSAANTTAHHQFHRGSRTAATATPSVLESATHVPHSTTKPPASISPSAPFSKKRPLVEAKEGLNNAVENSDDDRKFSSKKTPPSSSNKRSRPLQEPSSTGPGRGARPLKAVIVLDANTGGFQDSYISAATAARALAVAMPGRSVHGLETGIGQVLAGRQKSCAGYIFKYQTDDDEEPTTPADSVGNNSRIFVDKRPRPTPKSKKKSSSIATATPTSTTARHKQSPRKVVSKTKTPPASSKSESSGKKTGSASKKDQLLSKGPVEQYCARTGDYQCRYETAREAAEEFVKNNPGSKMDSASKGISRVLRNERVQYFNLFFRYEHDTRPLPSKFPLTSRTQLFHHNDSNNGENTASLEAGHTTQKEGEDDAQDPETNQKGGETMGVQSKATEPKSFAFDRVDTNKEDGDKKIAAATLSDSANQEKEKLLDAEQPQRANGGDKDSPLEATASDKAIFESDTETDSSDGGDAESKRVETQKPHVENTNPDLNNQRRIHSTTRSNDTESEKEPENDDDNSGNKQDDGGTETTKSTTQKGGFVTL